MSQNKTQGSLLYYPLDCYEGMSNQEQLWSIEREIGRREWVAQYANLADEHVLAEMNKPSGSGSVRAFPSMNEAVMNIYYDLDKHGDPVHVPPVLPMNVRVVNSSLDIIVGKRPKDVAKGKKIVIKGNFMFSVGKYAPPFNTFVFILKKHLIVCDDRSQQRRLVDHEGHPLKAGFWRTMLPSEVRTAMGVEW